MLSAYGGELTKGHRLRFRVRWTGVGIVMRLQAVELPNEIHVRHRRSRCIAPSALFYTVGVVRFVIASVPNSGTKKGLSLGLLIRRKPLTHTG